MTTLAVMQPTFLPWIGYFDLIDQADCFVYLDTVEFSRQSWQQRNRIKTAAGLTWLSLPVAASKTERTTIADARVGPVEAVRKWRSTIAQAYARAGAVSGELPWIDAWLAGLAAGVPLADCNIDFIERACGRLGIATRRHRASDLDGEDGRVERLIGLCRSLGATAYLSPAGAAGYLEGAQGAFRSAGIELLFHAYEHPVYAQCHGAFQTHASVVDLLLNLGDAAAAVMRSGRRPPIPADQFFRHGTDSDDGGQDSAA